MQNLLVPIDFSDVTAEVLNQAAALALQLNGKIRLLHAAPPDPDFVGYEAGPQTVRDQVADRLHKEHRELQQFAEQLRQKKVDVTPLLVQGRTVETIIEEAAKWPAHLIILGSHGHGSLYRTLVGSICEGVLRKAACPVFIVPAPGRSHA